MVACIVCGGECSRLDVLDLNRSCDIGQGQVFPNSGIIVDYVLCHDCGFCFAPEFGDWQQEDFANKIYNQAYVLVDPDYVEVRPSANAKMLRQYFGFAKEQISHLDYGGGSGRLVALLLESEWDSTNFDPYGQLTEATMPDGSYNLITAYEVFEHAADVNGLAHALANLIEPSGLILFSTLVSDEHIFPNKPLNWWYAAPRNGHISLFSRKSLKLLGERVGLNFVSFSENLHAYYKNFPSWAQALMEDCTAQNTAIELQKSKMNNLNKNFNQLAQTRYGPMLYNRFDKYVGGSIAAYGEFSEGEAAMFGQLVGAGSLVIEAGANIGAHTVHLAQLVGEQGAIYAFEPQRVVFQTLCANLSLNQLVNVTARQQGLGRSLGEMVLPNVDPRIENNFGGLSLLQAGQGEKVAIVTIDSLALPRCDLIKVDVEGMEEEVLAGALNTIAQFRPTLYLENDRVEKSASLIRFLQSLNYKIWWHLSPLFNPNNFAKNSTNIFGSIVSINILCQPAESAKPVNGLREILDANEQWNRPT